MAKNKPKPATLKLGDKSVDLPIVESTEGHRGIDINGLREKLGCTAYDNGFANTSVCASKITFIDGEKGTLRYRGYNIADLAENCSFVEVAYLLVHGKLPNLRQLQTFSKYLNEHSMIHEDMHHFFNGYPEGAHPMAVMASMVTSLSSFYPELEHKEPNFDITAARLISKIRTIAACSYRKTQGLAIVYPRHDLSYCENFLNMMFSSPVNRFSLNPLAVHALNSLLILHADHGQNCSTTAVRLVASARGNLYAAISAGICALWGSLHGGANQAVIEMLRQIKRDGRRIGKYIDKAKDKSDPFRLFGFGHPVYKSYDPRAKIAKRICDALLLELKIDDPMLEIAKELEEIALSDDYFVRRRLYPNVDFYTGIIYRAMGIPTNMLTVMFAIGRLPGWIAQWKETTDVEGGKIYRPRQVYTGPTEQEFVAVKRRS